MVAVSIAVQARAEAATMARPGAAIQAYQRDQGLSVDELYTSIRWQILLHMIFIASALLLALTELIMARRYRSGEGHAEDKAAPHSAA